MSRPLKGLGWALAVAAAVVAVSGCDPNNWNPYNSPLPPMYVATGPTSQLGTLSIAGPTLLVEKGGHGTYFAMVAVGNGPAERVHDHVEWSSSDGAVLAYNGEEDNGQGLFIPIKAGSSLVEARYGVLKATLLVVVEASLDSPPPPDPVPSQLVTLNGIYDVEVHGIANGCGTAVHSTRDFTGTLTVANLTAAGTDGSAELREPTTSLLYSATAALASEGLTLTLRLSTGVLTCVLPLTQVASPPSQYRGTESITGPNGCQATYSWLATKR